MAYVARFDLGVSQWVIVDSSYENVGKVYDEAIEAIAHEDWETALRKFQWS